MKKVFWLASTALVVGLGQASASWAQQAELPTVDIDDVVVTAERFGSGLTRATFTLGAEDIGERPLGADIMQSLVKVPGVQVSTGDARGGSFSFELYMRGLNKEQIGLTIDGIPTGDARFNGGCPQHGSLKPATSAGSSCHRVRLTSEPLRVLRWAASSIS